ASIVRGPLQVFKNRTGWRRRRMIERKPRVTKLTTSSFRVSKTLRGRNHTEGSEKTSTARVNRSDNIDKPYSRGRSPRSPQLPFRVRLRTVVGAWENIVFHLKRFFRTEENC